MGWPGASGRATKLGPLASARCEQTGWNKFRGAIGNFMAS
jgi:hypothetical protein